jgi:hypothetical protein
MTPIVSSFFTILPPIITAKTDEELLAERE